MKIIPALLFLFLLLSCASSARKAAIWQPVNNATNITCKLRTETSGLLFLSQLSIKNINTNLAPDGVITLEASTMGNNAVIISKKLRRYISSINDYSTLSGLEIWINLSEQNGIMTMTPEKKKEYQVSVIGSWPIPKIDMEELVEYFGAQCSIKK